MPTARPGLEKALAAPGAQKAPAPGAQEARAPGAQRARAPGAQKARAYNRRAKSARLYVGPTTVWYMWF